MTDDTPNPATPPDAWVTRLADIAMPAPPDWQPVMLYGGIAILVALSVIAGGIWFRFRRRRYGRGRPERSTALRQLDRLYAQWRSGAAGDRETAYRLTLILRRGLGLRQLSDECPAGLTADPQWRETVALLRTQRYEAQPAERLPGEIFNRARRWLRQRTASERTTPC